MYNASFCDIYNEYGWNDFSVCMGESILDYMNKNSISVCKHLDLCSGTGEFIKRE